MGLLLALPTVSLLAASIAQSTDEGKALFQEKCASCHTIGQGDRLGPDLKGVTTNRERDWLARWLLDPKKMINEKDPIVVELLRKYNNIPMPNMGLTESQVTDLISYMEAQDKGISVIEKTQTQSSPLPEDDSATGKSLFTGVIPFQNSGSPCIACHSIAGMTGLGGGTLGPDLTNAYSKYGEAGTASILASLSFPTMSPIYAKRPLTPEEQSNLKAFLQSAAIAKQPTQTLAKLVILAVLGAALLLVIFQVLWRRRLKEVRRPFVSQGPESGKTTGRPGQ